MIFQTNDNLPIQEQFNLLLDQLNMMLEGYGTDDSGSVWYGNDQIMPAGYDVQILEEENDSMLAVTNELIYENETISAGGYVGATNHDLTPPDDASQWRALALAGWGVSYRDIRLSTAYISGAASIYAGLHSDSEYSRTVNVRVYILWTKV